MTLKELRALVDKMCDQGCAEDRVKVLIQGGGREYIFTPDELLSDLQWSSGFHVVHLTVQESLDVD